MLTVTDLFLATLRVPHVVALTVTLEVPGAPPVDVAVIEGEITEDASASNRRTGRLRIDWPISFQLTAGDGTVIDLRNLPFGTYVRPKRGVRYADGTTETVELGRLRVESVAWDTLAGPAAAAIAVDLELADGMAQVHDEPLTTPYAAGGKKPSNAIVELVQAVHGTAIAYHLLTTPSTEPTLADVSYAGERDKAVADLAAAVGAEAFFDHHGDLVVQPLPTTGGTSVWEIDEGAQGVLVGANETLDRTDTVNGVLVRGQASADTAPVESLVTDTEPASPTRWGGPFGKVALIVESQAVQTVPQATDAATKQLDARLGLARNVTVRSVPNPALVPGDIVEIKFPGGRTETHRLGAVHVPFNVHDPVEVASRSVYRPAGALERIGTRELAGARLVAA